MKLRKLGHHSHSPPTYGEAKTADQWVQQMPPGRRWRLPWWLIARRTPGSAQVISAQVTEGIGIAFGSSFGCIDPFFQDLNVDRKVAPLVWASFMDNTNNCVATINYRASRHALCKLLRHLNHLHCTPYR